MIRKTINYIGKERKKGNSYLSIIISGLKILLFRPYGNVICGFSMYDKPLLVSYSRSGTNWVRYFIESNTGKATPGQKRLIEGYDYYIDRAHAGYTTMHNYRKVLFLVRDYKECIVRHHGINNIRENYNTLQDFLNNDNIKQPVSCYIENIRAFDNLKKDKLIIYYEDLISNPSKYLQQIGEFLEIKKSKLDKFLEDIDYHKSNSIKLYTLGGHSSETTGKVTKLNYHRNKMTQKEIFEFDAFFRDKSKDLYNKYLKRYEFNNL